MEDGIMRLLQSQERILKVISEEAQGWMDALYRDAFNPEAFMRFVAGMGIAGIHCRKGYPLSPNSGNGHIGIERLARGEALALAPCQKCADFDSMGPPIPRNERGWLNKKGANEHVA